MPTKYKMSWCPGEKSKHGKRWRGRWRKRYRMTECKAAGIPGEKYFDPQAEETKTASYDRCWRDCRLWMSEVDRKLDDGVAASVREAWQPVLNALRRFQQLTRDSHGESERSYYIYRELERWNTHIIEPSITKGVEPIGVESLIESIRNEYTALINSDRVQLITGQGDLYGFDVNNPDVIKVDKGAGLPPWEEEQDSDTSLAALAKRLTGEIKAKRSTKYVCLFHDRLQKFLDWLPGNCTASEAFSGSTLSAYLHHMLERNLADQTKSDHIASVKQFARWLYNIESLEEVPRIIATGRFSVDVSRKKINPYSDGDITAILSEAKGREKLYVLLALNCGMLQGDIASLHPAEINWQRGTITRQRSKKKKTEDPPTVCWSLWPETLKLLREHRSDDPERLLVNKQGRSLVLNEEINSKLKTTDAIAKTMARIRERMGRKDPISFKRFRTTAASKLGEHGEYRSHAQHFLGHAPTTVADRHYVTPDQRQFDLALLWLRKQFLTQPSRSSANC